MNEVLQCVDVSERDRFVDIEAFPVVQRVAVIAEDWRTPEQGGSLAEGQRDICGQDRRFRLRNLVYVRRCEKADANVIQAQEWKRVLLERAIGPLRNRQASGVIS